MARSLKSSTFSRRRRTLVLACAGLAALAFGPAAGRADGPPPPPLGPDGLYHPAWFKKSDLDLSKDLADATAKGKILALFFEQRGCSYCRRMHLENFAYPEIVDYVRAHFEAVQLDFRGGREVAHVTGETMTERELARRYQVNGTPNIVFLDGKGDMVFRMPGYAEPALFLVVFQYVKEKGYAQGSIQDWIKSRP